MKLSSKSVIISLACTAFALAAGAFCLQVLKSTVYTDASLIRVPFSVAPIRRVLWQPASPIPGAINTDSDEYEPRVSADGSMMIFVRGKPGANADLYVSHWSPDGWTSPAPIPAINSPADELGPELSRDGQTLFFYSDRPGGLGGYDVWASRLADGNWTQPVNLGENVNSSHNEYSPALTPDGKVLYFASNRPRPSEPARERDAWSGTVRESRDRHDYDLYAAPIDALTPQPAQALVSLNTPFDEGAPSISPAGDFLYFASDRPGGAGGFDIYRARLLAGMLSTPEGLGPAVNSEFNDLDPSLSMDGFRLCFSSDRPTPSHSPPPNRTGPADYGLWTSTSREVFLESDLASACNGLFALFRDIWPWLILLLPLPLLFIAFRDPRFSRTFRRLSLLAQCVIISLLIHAAVGAVLAAWKVGSHIGDFLRDGGGPSGRVIIASAGVNDGVIRQIQSDLVSAPQLQADLSAASSQLDLGALQAPSLHADTPQSQPLEIADATPVQPPSLSVPERSILIPSIAAPDLPAREMLTPQLQPAPATSEPVAQAPEPSTTLANTSASLNITRSLVQPSVTVDVPANQPTVDTALSISPPVSPNQGLASLPPAPQPPRVSSPATSPASPQVAVPALPSPVASSEATAHTSIESQSAAPIPTLPLTTGQSVKQSPVSIQPAANAPAPQTLLSGPVPAPAPLPAAPPSAPISPSAPSAPPQSWAHTPRLPESRPADAAAASEPTASPAEPLRMTQLPSSSLALPALALAAPQTPATVPAAGNVAPLALGSTPVAIAPAPIHTPTVSTPPQWSSRPPPSAPSVSPALPKIVQSETQPLDTFAQRSPQVRDQVLVQMGGSTQTELAVTRALDWFTAHQEPDGHWSGPHFDDRCGKCGGASEIDSDTAMTGMALLCFLGAGHTHAVSGPYQPKVHNALNWLIARQAPSGDLRHAETMYSHTIATVALCEAFAMTRDVRIESAARRAVSFMLASRSGAADDTSVLGWQIMAIESARRCGFPVPAAPFDNAREWLDQMSRPGARGVYSYRRDEAPSPAMTAEAMFVQQLLGRSRSEPRMQQSARFILETPPRWRDGAPTYYWYYATLALFQHQGDSWKQWNEQLMPQLLEHQHAEGPAAGSWDPQDYWSRLGGRIYQTAICTLSLEVYYRYRPAGLKMPFAPPPAQPAPEPAPQPAVQPHAQP